MDRKIAAITLLAVICFFAGYMARKPNNRSDSKHTQADEKTPIGLASKPPNTAAHTKNHANDDPPHWYASPEWWLVVIAFPTLYFLWYEASKTAEAAEATQKSAAATKDSADAANLNAKALIDSERPWLLIPPDGIRELQVFPAEKDNGKHVTNCGFRIKNYGHTPGKICASKVELQIGDSPSSPPDADVYDMRNATHNITTFPPGEVIDSVASLAPLGLINMEQRDAVFKMHTNFLWLCGFIRYRDTFDRKNAPECETRFCYLYVTSTNAGNFWKLAGPSEYNRAT